MTTIPILLLATAATMTAPVEVFRSGSDYVLYQEATKTYTIGYVCATDGKGRVIEYAAPTNFDADVKASSRDVGDGTVEYVYSVKNLAGSRQSIQRVWVPSPTEGKAPDTANAWRFLQSPGTDGAFALGWQNGCKDMDSCLQAGERAGFQFTTASLPIIGQARLAAWEPLLKYCGEGPNADVSYYLDRHVFSEDASHVSVRTTVPGIAIDPADVSTVMASLAEYIDRLADDGEMERSVADEIVAHVRDASGFAQDGHRDLSARQLKEARQVLNTANTGRSGKGMAKDLVDVLRFDLEYLLSAVGQ